MTFKNPETGNTHSLDKSLRDYTAGEIHDICVDVTNCRACPFLPEGGACPFYDQTPELWRLEEEDNE